MVLSTLTDIYTRLHKQTPTWAIHKGLTPTVNTQTSNNKFRKVQSILTSENSPGLQYIRIREVFPQLQSPTTTILDLTKVTSDSVSGLVGALIVSFVGVGLRAESPFRGINTNSEQAWSFIGVVRLESVLI